MLFDTALIRELNPIEIADANDKILLRHARWKKYEEDNNLPVTQVRESSGIAAMVQKEFDQAEIDQTNIDLTEIDQTETYESGSRSV